MRYQTTVIQEGFDGITCWTQSRIGVMGDLYVLNTQKLNLKGSDVYGIVHSCFSKIKAKHGRP
jgi:hypothetical protein